MDIKTSLLRADIDEEIFKKYWGKYEKNVKIKN